MLLFTFFMAVFSSVSWLIYAIMFVNAKLLTEELWEQSSLEMLILLLVVFLPPLIIWLVFGCINQFAFNRGMNVKQNELLKQLQKNQDYTDLVVRVMLDAEHEIKDGFVINKFDTFIADMNEALSEIIQRCNIASSAQLEQLWQRVKRGEKWTLGKAILDASKSQSTFDAWVKEKVNRDKVFRGTLLEFCSRYQNLLQLLEKHDRDRIFLRIIETGVFGKVYSIIAPLAEGIRSPVILQEDKIKTENNKDYSSVLKLANLEEPKASESIVNVDKNDDDDDDFLPQEPKMSIFARLNPFKSKEKDTFDDEHDRDPFFQALHNSFRSDENNKSEGFLAEPKFVSEPVEPSFASNGLDTDKAISSDDKKLPSFGGVRNTLDTLKNVSANKTNESYNKKSVEKKLFEASHEADKKESFETANKIISAMNKQPDVAETKADKKDDDLVYPFGGWTDEENYNK